jgi:hypothetical protein
MKKLLGIVVIAIFVLPVALFSMFIYLVDYCIDAAKEVLEYVGLLCRRCGINCECPKGFGIN